MELNDRQQSNKQLMKYAGLTMQFLVSIALGIFLGVKADKWIQLSFPLFTWLLPLLIIAGILLKIINETGKK